MLKKAGAALEKWGHYVLALLCAAAILLSALWTREQRQGDEPGAQALNDQSQRLSEAMRTPEPENMALTRPVKGEITRGYSDGAVYFNPPGVWSVHRAVDFAAEDGERVLALAAGTVVSCADGVRVDHGGGRESLYRGLKTVLVQPGEKIKAGQTLGTAGGRVPFEEENCHVCVAWLQDGQRTDFSGAWNGDD